MKGRHLKSAKFQAGGGMALAIKADSADPQRRTNQPDSV
jgi:hypothetical protein